MMKTQKGKKSAQQSGNGKGEGYVRSQEDAAARAYVLAEFAPREKIEENLLASSRLTAALFRSLRHCIPFLLPAMWSPTVLTFIRACFTLQLEPLGRSVLCHPPP